MSVKYAQIFSLWEKQQFNPSTIYWTNLFSLYSAVIRIQGISNGSGSKIHIVKKNLLIVFCMIIHKKKKAEN